MLSEYKTGNNLCRSRGQAQSGGEWRHSPRRGNHANKFNYFVLKISITISIGEH